MNLVLYFSCIATAVSFQQIKTTTIGRIPLKQLTLQYASSQLNSPSAEADGKNKEKEEQHVQNLYEILGAHPSASSYGIKQAYYDIAKQTHPDAKRRRTEQQQESDAGDGAITVPLRSSMIDFKDVVAAYEVLRDPKERKKYDRELQAQQFTEQVNTMASEMAENSYSSLSKMMDDIAVPFIRRTTATTVAAATKFANSTIERSSSAASKNSDSLSGRTEQQNWKSAFDEAFVAAQRAGKMVDGIETLEQLEKVEKSAKSKMNKAYSLKTELESTKKKRIAMTLQIPNSSFSSHDATDFISQWDGGSLHNEESYLSIFDRDIWGRSMKQSIDDLSEMEDHVVEIKTMSSNVTKILNQDKQKYEHAKSNVESAIETQKKAEEALIAAQKQVQQGKANLATSSMEMSQMEMKARKVYTERDRLFKLLAKKQEKVRMAVQRRAQTVQIQQSRNADSDPSMIKDNLNAEDDFFHLFQSSTENVNMNESIKIREEEKALNDEYDRLTVQSRRLMLKAQELKEKARSLEEFM